MDVNTANQSTTDEQMMDILLVLDKEKKTISAVKGVDENGELQTVPPENNSELLKFDRHGDFFSNFFSNMMNQLKNPTRFNFFKIPKIELPKITPIIRDNFDHPTAKNEAEIERYRVTPETLKQGVTNEQPNQTQQQVRQPQQEATAQTPQQPDKSKYVIDPDKVDWDALKNFGLSKEQLEKAKALEPMLRGYKSPGAFSIAGNYNSAIMKLDARLSFRHDKDGNVVLAIHGIRQKPGLERPFFGHEFSKEDKANLLETGNMGRIVNLKNYITGEMIPSFVSVDKVTNELVSMRASSVQIPDEIKGVKLSKEQQQALREGKGVFLENMISNRKNPFSATVQVNADKKSLEFIYPNAKQSQEQGQKQQQPNNLVTSDGVTIPKSISGIELSRQQQQDLVDDKTIFVAGLKDKRGVEYDAYIQVNHDKKKLGFYSDNPSFDRSAVQKLAPQASYYPCNETLRPEFYTPPVWHPRTFGEAPVLLLSQGNYPLKNLHTVLKALPAVLAQYPGAVLRVAGWPPLDKGPLLRPVIDWMFPYQTWCKQLIRRLGLADHVQYTGPLDAAAMRQAYLDADLFLLPSYSENSPSLGEAMLLGLPCVASAAGGIPDMLQSGVQGMLYGAAGDDAALSAAILQVLALPDHGTALGTAAQIRARVTHDAAKNTAQMIEIYRKVLQREGTL